jgi:STE24 endopeptidase
MLSPIYLEYSFYTLALMGLIIKLFLNYLNYRHIDAHKKHVPTRFVHLINLTDHQKAACYNKEKLLFQTFNSVIHFTMLMAWTAMGALGLLDQLVSAWVSDGLLKGLLFVAFFSFINSIIDLPMNLYFTFILEEKYGFNKTTLKLYFLDTMKVILLSSVIGAILFSTILMMMEQFPKAWWALCWVLITLFQFIMIWAYPVFIAPLFNKFEKLSNRELKDEIDALLLKAGLQFKDYFVMDASLRSSHGNAYFTGLGKNKRIVFFDTLLKKLENAEIIAVLAHELGHLKHRHILKSLITSFFATGFLLAIMQLCHRSDFFAVFNTSQSTYMLLIIFSLILPVYTFPLTPLLSYISRKKEFEADAFAVKKSDGASLISALIKLHRDNSTSLTPSPLYSKFYYSHPQAKERIEAIESLSID